MVYDLLIGNNTNTMREVTSPGGRVASVKDGYIGGDQVITPSTLPLHPNAMSIILIFNKQL